MSASSNNDAQYDNSNISGRGTDKVALGFFLLLLSLIFLGTWPALLRLASITRPQHPPRIRNTVIQHKHSHFCGVCEPFTCFQCQPRDARFVYLDYAFSYVISSMFILLLIVMFSDNNEQTTTTTNNNTFNDNNIHNIPWILVSFAMIGGVLLSIGNLSLQWATTVYEAPLTTVVAIQASLTVILGTNINYILQPLKTAHRNLLLVGVIVFLAAIAAATEAHLLNGHWKSEQQPLRNKQKEDGCTTDNISCDNEDNNGTGYTVVKSPPSAIELQQTNPNRSVNYKYLESLDDKVDLVHNSQSNTISIVHAIQAEEVNGHLRHEEVWNDEPYEVVTSTNLAQPTTYSELQTNWLSFSSFTKSQKALTLAIGGGCCFGFFSPAFNIAVNDPFRLSTKNPLSGPVANVWFSLAFTISSIVGTTQLMYQPPTGSGLSVVSWYEYWNHQGPIQNRLLGILAGCLCGFANMLQFQGGLLVGFATADLVQAYPIISTLWDIYLFGEYRTLITIQETYDMNNDDSVHDNNHDKNKISASNTKVRCYLTAMYILYLNGIICMMFSASLVE